MISSNKTPNANTSVFSSTIPCIKYSGAKYLKFIKKFVSPDDYKLLK